MQRGIIVNVKYYIFSRAKYNTIVIVYTRRTYNRNILSFNLILKKNMKNYMNDVFILTLVLIGNYSYSAYCSDGRFLNLREGKC